MAKRALCGVAAVVTVAASLAFTVSPTAASVRRTAAPRTGKAAVKILRADVAKLARDYAHRRYRAVCSDLTRRERKHLGGRSQCMFTVAVLNAFVSIKKYTIVAAKLGKRHSRGTVSLIVNGNRKHVVHAVVKWERRAYRLDRESGWHPTL
jgi:hypothetical protein